MYGNYILDMDQELCLFIFKINLEDTILTVIYKNIYI